MIIPIIASRGCESLFFFGGGGGGGRIFRHYLIAIFQMSSRINEINIFNNRSDPRHRRLDNDM